MAHQNAFTRYVAFDIETCALPLDDLAPALADRAARRVAAESPRQDETLVDTSDRVRATDTALHWICCIGIVSTSDPHAVPEPTTFAAAHPGDEARMLGRFWDAVAAFASKHPQARWISFNGKNFDVPSLLLRSAAHGIRPVSCGMLYTYPYASRPHTDLMHLVGGSQRLRLAELCATLGVDSPKDGQVGGDGVAAAVESGRLALVEQYCKADVAATMACYARLRFVEDACASVKRW